MKYLMFLEPIDFDKAIEKSNELYADEKWEEKYGPDISEGYKICGQRKTVLLIEATPEQLARLDAYWVPWAKVKFLPIIEISKWFEEYEKTKK